VGSRKADSAEIVSLIGARGRAGRPKCVVGARWQAERRRDPVQARRFSPRSVVRLDVGGPIAAATRAMRDKRMMVEVALGNASADASAEPGGALGCESVALDVRSQPRENSPNRCFRSL